MSIKGKASGAKKKPNANKIKTEKSKGKEKSKPKKFQSINDCYYKVLIEECMINGAVTSVLEKDQ